MTAAIAPGLFRLALPLFLSSLKPAPHNTPRTFISQAIVGVIAKESKDQLRGVDFHGVGDADLFVLDTDQRSEPAGPPSSSGKSRRELKKEQARSKMTRAQAILSESQAGKTVPKGPKPSEKQALALPRQVQKAALASGPKKRKAPAPPVEDNDAVEADVWVSGSDGEGGRRRRVVSKPNRPKIRAVEVDMPGCSYNPREDDHEDAIARAVAKEMAKELRKVLEPAAPPKHLIGESASKFLTNSCYFYDRTLPTPNTV